MQHRVFIALGSNLDDPAGKVKQGFAAISRLRGTRLAAQSSLYASAPVGYADQPDFINAVAEVETALAPRALLDALQAIEREHGRERRFRDGPRTLDLDLLLYGEQRIDEPGLSLPHPRMHERAFVLAPLVEIAPGSVIPGKGPAADWLARCTDQTITRVAIS